MKVNSVHHRPQKPHGTVLQVSTNAVGEMAAFVHTADWLLFAGPGYPAALDGMCLEELQMVVLAKRTRF